MCTLGTGNDMSESLRHREGPIMASRGWVIASKGKQGHTWSIGEQIYTPSCFYFNHPCLTFKRLLSLCVHGQALLTPPAPPCPTAPLLSSWSSNASCHLVTRPLCMLLPPHCTLNLFLVESYSVSALS